ncbi:MAG: SET domain-containing protein-lysine N-methyltransferase [Kofleriaceae bacterium]
MCFGDGVLYREDDDFDDTYALILPEEDSGTGCDLFWDLVDQTRWFNHSCAPNTEVHSSWDHDAKTVRAWWVALRDIPVGDEITYDYGFVADVAEVCACGTPECRGLIVDPDEANKVAPELRHYLRRAS